MQHIFSKKIVTIATLAVGTLVLLTVMQQASAQFNDYGITPTIEQVSSGSGSFGGFQGTSGGTSYTTVDSSKGGVVTNSSGAISSSPAYLGTSAATVLTSSAPTYKNTTSGTTASAPRVIAASASSGGGGSGGTNFESSCSGGSLISSCGSYGQGGYFSCPGGYRIVNESSCCPNQYYQEVDTNGDGKGGVVGQCNIPSNPNNPGGSNAVNPTTSSCSVNGVSVPHGQTYTFYTQGSVPYGNQCSSVAYDRTCNNGVFDGNDNGFSRCVVDDAPQVSTITISAIPPIVRYGGSSVIQWDGGNAEACTVTGYGLTNVTGITGSVDVGNVVGESTYTLNCTLGPNSRSASTTLKVLPRTQET